MRIIFVGSSRFGHKCFREIIKMTEVEIVGAISTPETFKISYQEAGVKNILHADISGLATANKIPSIIVTGSMNDPILINTITDWEPDAFIVIGWYHMIPKSWRQLAPAYGLHASLLPDYSGGAPLVWAMINGETKTGITCFQMNDGVDSGPIVGQLEEFILTGDTIATLYARIEQKGIELLRNILPKMAAGKLVLKAQDETKRRVMPQRSPQDGLIDWNEDATKIIRFINAQTRPYPGAYTTLAGKKLYIWSAYLVYTEEEDKAGVVKKLPDGPHVITCKRNAVALSEIGFESITYKSSKIHLILGNERLQLDSLNA